ncbi:hypothetical protein E2320_002336 [Naja naja]|nr:hypothetical protein E2320_002336 [Naja naja]
MEVDPWPLLTLAFLPDHFKRNCPKTFKGRGPFEYPQPYYTSYQRERSTMDKDIKIHPSSQRHDVNPRCRKSPSPKRSRRSSRENNGTDTESVNGVREVEPNLGANLREQCWLIDSKQQHTHLAIESCSPFR